MTSAVEKVISTLNNLDHLLYLHSESTQLNTQRMLLLALFLLLLGGVSGAETDETMSVMEGDSVTLHTNLTEVPNDGNILWLFGSKDTLIAQITRKHDLTTFFVTDDERFRGRLQVDKKTGSLTIRKTRIKHSGQYKLSISREKTTTKIFSVTVSGVVGETDGVKSVSVMEGESVTLNTDAEVQRDDLIVWRFGDKGTLLAKIDVETNETSLNNADKRFRDRLKLDQTGSLTIKKTKTEHSGLYEVQIRGSESSQRFLLSVSAVPGLSRGGIAGIVVAALLVAAVLSSVVIYYRRKISKLENKVEKTEEKVSVVDGKSVTLKTNTILQGDDCVKWWHQDENNLIAEINRKTNKTYIVCDEIFRDRLTLENETGNLEITNTVIVRSGLYILQISSKTRTINKRFILTVTEEVSVADGHFVTLETKTDLQGADWVKWWYQDESDLIAEINGETEKTYYGFDKRFRDRLKLETGNLKITNTVTVHSGLFILQISRKNRTINKRFILTISVKAKSAEVGGFVSLETDAVVKPGDLILWTFGPENRLVVKADSGKTVGERFRDRLELDMRNGSLTIRNLTDKDSGRFKLQIINSEVTTFERFNVTVTDSRGEQQKDSTKVEMQPLMEKEDEVNEG